MDDTEDDTEAELRAMYRECLFGYLCMGTSLIGEAEMLKAARKAIADIRRISRDLDKRSGA